jgi:hypothetical protein
VAVATFYDALIIQGTYNASGDHNEVSVETKADTLEKTVFSNDTHVFAPGLRSIELSGKGYVQYDDSITPKAVDFQDFNAVSVSNPFTVASSTAAGATAYLGTLVNSEYSWTLKNDALGMFDIKAKAGNVFTRGTLVVPLAAYTASAVSTIYQLGALSATQKLYACLHVTAFNGTSLDALVKSNDTNNTTTPTTRITFTTAAAVTSEFKQVSGAITDTYWYIDYAFVGTSVTFAVSFGVR